MRDEPLAVAQRYQPEIESMYRRMLDDLVCPPDERRPAWGDFANPAVVTALGGVERVAWNLAARAVLARRVPRQRVPGDRSARCWMSRDTRIEGE